MTFAGEPKSEVVDHVHESTPWIKEPLIILTVITAIGGFALAVLGVVDFLSNKSDNLSLHGHADSLLGQIVYELKHAFLPDDMKLRFVGWVTIFLSFIVGPIMASRVHGGRLKEGEKANIFVGWLVNLSGKFGTQDVSWLAESQLAEALDKRLYFDDLYEGIITRTVIPFAEFSAWFDRNIIDGVIKQIESNSVLCSVQIRKVTTGSARDYILMATVGALCIFALLMGVNS
jgi:NADH:ubiquinone oxidoreductase subunit 5 (subunit L)/multisubunit Na+/H+ antiporter MnhA subunit